MIANVLRRAGRYLLTTLSMLSLLLCVATLMLWVRSHYVVEGLIYQPKIDYVLRLYQVSSGRGTLLIGTGAAEPSPTSALYYWSFVATPSSMFLPVWAGEHRFLGFSFISNLERVQYKSTPEHWPIIRVFELNLPHWVVALILACLPADWLLRRRGREIRRRRLERGECPRCGYDLRATRDRCPECGTAVTAGPPDAAASPPLTAPPAS